MISDRSGVTSQGCDVSYFTLRESCYTCACVGFAAPSDQACTVYDGRVVGYNLTKLKLPRNKHITQNLIRYRNFTLYIQRKKKSVFNGLGLFGRFDRTCWKASLGATWYSFLDNGNNFVCPRYFWLHFVLYEFCWFKKSTRRFRILSNSGVRLQGISGSIRRNRTKQILRIVCTFESMAPSESVIHFHNPERPFNFSQTWKASFKMQTSVTCTSTYDLKKIHLQKIYSLHLGLKFLLLDELTVYKISELVLNIVRGLTPWSPRSC